MFAAHQHRRTPLGRLPVVFYAHPFELAFAFLMALAGLRSLGVGGAVPPSLEDRLAEPVVVAWQAGTIAGGLLVLFGIGLRVKPFGRAVEKAGLYLLAGVTGAYSAALFGLGSSATFAACQYASLALGAIFRAGAIRRTERVILEQLRAAVISDDPILLRRLVDGRPPEEL